MKVHLVQTVQEFEQEFNRQLSNDDDCTIHYQVSPKLIGRICKATDATDKELTLTDCSTDRTCYFMGHDGLEKLLQIGAKNQYAMLHAIGFESKYIEEKVNLGIIFDLLVLESDSSSEAPSEISYPATWNGLYKMVQHLFPDVYQHIYKYEAIMSQRKFEYYKEIFPNFFEVRAFGKSHPDYLNYTRFKDRYTSESPTITATELNARQFFYYEMGTRDLFAGDGYTYNENGERGLLEYMYQNKKRSQITNPHVFIRLNNISII
jgi:hypothetical protein